MDNRLEKIYHDTIPHSFFLNKSSIDTCMYQAYNLAVDDVFQWLSEKDYLTDDIKTLKDEWFQKNKKS